MIPVLFLHTVEINPDLFGYFSFSMETLVQSQIIIAMESMILLILNANYVPQRFLNGFSVLSRPKSVYALCKIIVFIFVITSCIALFAIINAIKANGFIKAFFLLDELGDKYRKLFKFQTLRYVSVVCVFYLFLKKKKFSLFLVFVPNIFFEVLAGKRTTAFLYILFVYIIYVKIYDKPRLFVIGSIFVSLLMSVLFSRMGSLNNGNLSLDLIVASMLAEFINTFLTLPYILENDLTNCLEFPHVLYNLVSPILPGFIKTNIMQSSNFDEIGALLAGDIGKGFGFGSNCITYDLYSFGIFGLLCLPIMFVLICSLDRVISKDCNFMLRFFLIYQLRLYMRQGYESLAIVLFIAIFYNGLFYYLHRKYKREIVLIKIKRFKPLGSYLSWRKN